MVSIRAYKKSDFIKVRNLIVRTFKEINPCNADKKSVQRMVDSMTKNNPGGDDLRSRYDSAPICFVAVDKIKIVGVIRGDEIRLKNLYVDTTYFRKGIGKKLYEKFEAKARKLGYPHIKIYSSIYAIPFYEAVGFKKTRGPVKVKGLNMQPMKKILT